MAFILNSFFQESDIASRAAADEQMKEMTAMDIEHMVRMLETLPHEANLDSIKKLKQLNGFEMLEDYEYDTNVPEEGLKQIRRKMYSLFRKRFKEIMKLRREVKAREQAGHYTSRAKRDVLDSQFFPNSITPSVKRLTIICLLDVFYISIVTLFTPTAAMNSVMNNFATQMNGLWLVYWVPTILYLLSLLVAFSFGNRSALVASVSLGFASFLWHLLAMTLFFLAEREYPSAYAASRAKTLDAILWFIEMAISAIGIATHVRITAASGGFTKLDLEIIDSFELREFPYLISQRQLEQTANVQRQVYNTQLAEVNKRIETIDEDERYQLLKEMRQAAKQMGIRLEQMEPTGQSRQETVERQNNTLDTAEKQSVEDRGEQQNPNRVLFSYDKHFHGSR